MNNDNKNHLINAVKKNVRPDGRKTDEYREVKVKTGIIETAEGSAKVKIGDTEVIAGVKMAIESPYPDTPDQGNFMVNVELLPLSNPKFEIGPPSIDAIELARVTDRGIRESKAIDTAKLCLKKGEKVWSVIIDICPINDAGNLFDACSLAAIAALKDAKFPKTVEEDEHFTIDYHEHTNKHIELTKIPIGITVLKIGDQYVVDPVPEEEQVSDARMTVASIEDGTLCAIQKGGAQALTIDEINKMIELALKKAKMLLKLV